MTTNATILSTDPWDLYYNSDFVGAEAAFRIAAGNDPKDPVALDGLAAALMQLDRTDESVQLFSKAAGLLQAGSPERSRNLYGWAAALRKTGDLDRAETKANELVEVFGDFAPGWYLLGLICYDKRNFAGAEKAFRRALTLDPNDTSSPDKLFDTLIELGDKDQALGVVSVLNDLQKTANSADRARTLRNWAILLRERGDLSTAAVKAKELVESFPDYAPGWNTRAIILQANNDLNGAIHDYRQAVAVGKDAQPGDRAQWLLNLGDALRKKGLKQEALDAYRQADDINPDNPNVKNSMGLAHAALGDHKDAIAEYKKAEQLWSQANSSDRKYALRNLADVFIGQGQL